MPLSNIHSQSHINSPLHNVTASIIQVASIGTLKIGQAMHKSWYPISHYQAWPSAALSACQHWYSQLPGICSHYRMLDTLTTTIVYLSKHCLSRIWVGWLILCWMMEGFIMMVEEARVRSELGLFRARRFVAHVTFWLELMNIDWWIDPVCTFGAKSAWKARWRSVQWISCSDICRFSYQHQWL